jgi:hypothetical protein
MIDPKFSRTELRELIQRLRTDQEFRKWLFDESPSRCAFKLPPMSGIDSERLRAIKWDRTHPTSGPIDEKLVLCSSSGY